LTIIIYIYDNKKGILPPNFPVTKHYFPQGYFMFLVIFSRLENFCLSRWATVGLRVPARSLKVFTLFNDGYELRKSLFDRSPSSANKIGFQILKYLEKAGLD
jgi:hypothetical protein